jgi:hypothetical protein
MFILCGVLCGLGVPGGVAFADSAKEQAKAQFIQGKGHYDNARYAKALQAFEQANALTPHPLMVYNIAQVYEAMEDLPRAIQNYQRYLDSNPTDVAETTEKISALRATLSTWSAVELISVPSGASARVGAIDYPIRGETPLTLRLPPTRQKLILEKAGYKTIERPVQFGDGSQRRLSLTLTPILPVVKIMTTPPGARVRFDGGEPVGVTPVVHALPMGAHTVLLELDGYGPVKKEFSLTVAHTQSSPHALSLALERAVAKGRLALSVGGAALSVRLDGEVIGKTPFSTNVELTVGLHKVEVGSGDEVYTEMVSIEEGATATATISPSGSGFDKALWGYVGMGVGGALVLGGIATGLGALGADGDLTDCRADLACKGTSREVTLADDVRSSASTADVLVGLGLAIAGGGAVLYLLDAGEPEGSGTTFLVTPVKSGAAVMGSIRF